VFKRKFKIFAILTMFLVFPAQIFAADAFLDECLKLAQQRDSKISVAAEQIDLAQLRVTNSIRSFFPQLILQREFSKGKTALGNNSLTKYEYNSEQFGIRAVQPIYEGGATRSTLKFNNLMMDAAKLNYTKAKEELYVNVKLAYYEYLTLKMEYLALSKAFEKVET